MSRMVDVDNGIKGKLPQNMKSSSNNESCDIVKSLTQKNHATVGKSLKENQSDRDQYSPKQAIKSSKTKHSKSKAESLITASMSPIKESPLKEYSSKKKKSKKRKTTNIITGTPKTIVRDRKLLKLKQKLIKLQNDSPGYKTCEEKIKKLELEILAGNTESETRKPYPPLESTSSRPYETCTPQRLQQHQNNITPTIIVESTVSSSSSSVNSCSKKTILSSPTSMQIDVTDQDNNTLNNNKNIERSDIVKEPSRKKRSSNNIEDMNREDSCVESITKKDNPHHTEKKRRKTNKVVDANSSAAAEIHVKTDASTTVSRQSQNKSNQTINDHLSNATDPAKPYRWRSKYFNYVGQYSIIFVNFFYLAPAYVYTCRTSFGYKFH